MIEYFKGEFQKIAAEYAGEYEVQEYVYKGEGFSSMPVSDHKIIIPNNEFDLLIEFDFGDTSVCTLRTQMNNANAFKFFQFKKRSPFLLLFNKGLKSLIVETGNEKVKYDIEKLLLETGVENIAKNTLF